MSSDFEWETLSLKAAGVTLIDCDHKTPVAVSEGYPYIAIPQLKDGHIRLEGVRRISQSDYETWTKKLAPQEDDVIVVRRCSSGQSAHVPAGLKCAIGQNLVVLRADGKRVFPQYLRWLVRGSEWWSEVAKYINVGAVFDSLRCRDIPNFELPMPPLAEQREISSLLAALDDRISLLRETNSTLEAIAQTLFKSWFISFDPVHAKMEGRIPLGMDEATAGFFPDAVVESELGIVPKGWQVRPVGDVVDLVGGGTPDTKNSSYWNPPLHYWTTPKDLSNITSPVLHNTERKLSDQGLAKVSSGLLPVGTLLLSSRAPIGYLAMTQVPLAINQGYIAFKPGGILPALYMLFWCKQNMEQIKSRANGSTFMEISKKAFRTIPALIPPPAVLKSFTGTVDALFEKIFKNEIQVQILNEVRDALLPKLLSGQVTLPIAAEVQ